MGVHEEFEPKVGGTPPEDDPGSPPGPDATAEDQPEPTEPETAPMPRPSRQSRNAEVDFQGEKRSNATHASTTDPDARLYKKSPGTGAMLCSIGHALMDMKHGLPPVRGPCRLRNGLIVQGDLTQSDGHAERRAALDPRRFARTVYGWLPLGKCISIDAGVISVAAMYTASELQHVGCVP